MRAHKIDDSGNAGIELQERGPLMRDHDDPVELAGGESKYADMEISRADASGSGGISRPRAESHGLRDGLKKRIGSLKHKHRDE